jgi:hypothetical protein
MSTEAQPKPKVSSFITDYPGEGVITLHVLYQGKDRTAVTLSFLFRLNLTLRWTNFFIIT